MKKPHRLCDAAFPFAMRSGSRHPARPCLRQGRTGSSAQGRRQKGPEPVDAGRAGTICLWAGRLLGRLPALAYERKQHLADMPASCPGISARRCPCTRDGREAWQARGQQGKLLRRRHQGVCPKPCCRRSPYGWERDAIEDGVRQAQSPPGALPASGQAQIPSV